jgi:hypothetical protein
MNYVNTILNSTNHPNASLDVRIPGVFDYGAALQTHLLNLLNAANPDIDAEMDACAADMQVVTKNNLVQAQIAAYGRHLGLSE